MLKKLYIFISFLSISAWSLGQVNVDLGTGVTQVGATDYPAPYGHFYEGARHQMLVKASELYAAGAPGTVISSLGFNIGTISPFMDSTQNLEIKLGHTTLNSLTTFQSAASMTTVFNTPVFHEKLGWNQHNFQTNFTWNGVDNILVEVCFDNTAIGWDDHARTYMTDVGYSSVVWYRDDGDPNICTNSFIDNSSTERPDMRFGIIPDGNYNIMATQMIAPGNGCGLEDVMVVKVFNFGTSDTTNFDITYIVDNGTPVTETVTTNIPANTSLDYTFTTPITYSAATDTHSVVIYTTFAPDTTTDYDTIRTEIINEVQILAPFEENFDANSDGSFSPFANGWTSESTGFYQWQAETSLTSTPSTGPSQDHTTGSGTYLFTESSNGVTGDTAYLVSPCISLSGLSTPLLSFWYHKYGAVMGDMFVDILDGGVWYRVDTISGQTHTASSDAWNQEIIDLSAFGNSFIKIRFAGVKTSSTATGDMAIDDINVYQPAPFNAGVSKILNPETGCGLDSINEVTVEWVNYGYDTINTVYLSYQVDGGAVHTDTITGTILPYSMQTHTFTDSVGMTSGVAHSFKIYTTLAMDSIVNDDTLKVTIERLEGVSTFPYIEDFESSNGDWIEMGTNSTWAWGTPSATVISNAASGSKAWVTNLSGDAPFDELSYLESPCISFAGVGADPTISFAHIFELFFSDNWFEVSTDGGSTWTKLGTTGTGTNWYNSVVDTWEQQSGPTWRQAEHTLDGLANQANVKLRFVFDGSSTSEGVGVDDIVITVPYAQDMAMVGINSPTSECGLSSAEPVDVDIWNNGYDTAYSYTVSYILNGGTIVTDTVNNNPIPPGDTINYVFNDSVNVSTVGNYTITTIAEILDDGWSGNDSLVEVSFGNFLQPPTPVASVPVSVCPGNSTTLIETGGVGYVEWYDDSTGLQSLDTGSSYTTYPLPYTSTFYIQTSVGTPLYVGPTPGVGASNAYAGSGSGLLFDVLNPDGVVIQYVDINTAGTGEVSVSIWTSTNKLIISRDFNITSAGDNQIFLNAWVPAGTDYKMLLKGENVGGVLREKNVTDFPYTYPGEVEITDGTLSGYYYFFYNWTIRNPSCTSPRIAVTVPVGDLPIDLGPDTIVCLDGSISLDAGANTNYTYNWTTGDSIQKIEVFGSDYTQDTVIQIGVTVNDTVENCSGTDNIRLTISECLGINDLDLGVVKVFPNPASNVLFVDNGGYKGTGYVYQLVNIEGRTIRSGKWSKLNGNLLDMDISELSPGMYFMKIQSENDHMINKAIPIVIER